MINTRGKWLNNKIITKKENKKEIKIIWQSD